MKITADVKINQDGRTDLYSEKEFDDIVYNDLVLSFSKELKKMNPLLFKAEEHGYTRYQVQGIVLSMKTFQNLMEELQNMLPGEDFDRIRSLFNNTI